MVALCRRYLRSTGEAEEAAAEVLLKLDRLARDFDGRIDFQHWVLRAAGNHCIDVLRRRALEREWVAAGTREAAVAPPADRADSPIAALIAEEDRQRLRDAIDGLAGPARVALVLRYFEDLLYAEIAERMQVPIGTVATYSFGEGGAACAASQTGRPRVKCFLEEDLLRYADGELAEPERRDAVMHFAACPRCAALAAAFEAENDVLRGVLAAPWPHVQVGRARVGAQVAASVALLLVAPWVIVGLDELSLLSMALFAVDGFMTTLRVVSYPIALIVSLVFLAATARMAVRRRAVAAMVALLVLNAQAPSATGEADRARRHGQVR